MTQKSLDKNKQLYKSVCCGAKVKLVKDEIGEDIICQKCKQPCTLTLTKSGIEASVASSHSLSYPKNKPSIDVGGDKHEHKFGFKPSQFAPMFCGLCGKMIGVSEYLKIEKSKALAQQMEEIIEEVKGMKKQYHSVGGGEIGGYVDVPDDAYNRSVQKHNEIIDEVLSKLTSLKDENSGLEEK